MRNNTQRSFKVVLAGDHQLGKTSFMFRLTDPNRCQTPQPTIGTELVCYSVDVDGATCKLQLWDTAGQEAYRSITTTYFRNCKGVFLFFDLTQRHSFENLSAWLQTVYDNSNDPLVIIIANKCDLPAREVGSDEIAKFCRERSLPFFITSAKTGENVQNAASYMAAELTKRYRPTTKIDNVDIRQESDQKGNCCGI